MYFCENKAKHGAFVKFPSLCQVYEQTHILDCAHQAVIMVRTILSKLSHWLELNCRAGEAFEKFVSTSHIFSKTVTIEIHHKNCDPCSHSVKRKKSIFFPVSQACIPPGFLPATQVEVN